MSLIENARDVRTEFESHGWVREEGIFSRRELDSWRDKIKKSQAEKLTGDLLSNPYLHPIIYDERILATVTRILGGTPVYFGDSVANAGLEPGGLQFHKDCADRLDENGPDWTLGNYSLVRVGIYLQDHTNYSGGLALRDGSHNIPNLSGGRPIAVESIPGDLICWSLRTTHSGFAARLRLFPRFFFPIRVLSKLVDTTYRLPLIFRPLPVASPSDRMAVFITYGRRDKHLERYLLYLKTRKYAVDRWKRSQLDPAIVRSATARGTLEVIDLSAEAANIDLGPTDRGHMPLPY